MKAGVSFERHRPGGLCERTASVAMVGLRQRHTPAADNAPVARPRERQDDRCRPVERERERRADGRSPGGGAEMGEPRAAPPRAVRLREPCELRRAVTRARQLQSGEVQRPRAIRAGRGHLAAQRQRAEVRWGDDMGRTLRERDRRRLESPQIRERDPIAGPLARMTRQRAAERRRAGDRRRRDLGDRLVLESADVTVPRQSRRSPRRRSRPPCRCHCRPRPNRSRPSPSCS